MAYTTIDNPELYFQTKLYTGNSSTQVITLDGDEDMQPDFVWSKPRVSGGHFLSDSIRGGTKILQSAETNAETTRSNHIQSFNTDGYTLGADGTTNSNGDATVSWNWKAGSGTSTNTTGNGPDTTINVNQTAGFSIVTWTGDGDARTFGHGLGANADVVIVKNRESGSSSAWFVNHISVANTKALYLNTNGAEATDAIWGNAAPDSNTFKFDTDNTNNFVAYCFAEKQGYSKFSSFVGNGNADGTYVHLGFRPAWVMIKSTGLNSWEILDNKRNPFNVMGKSIFPDGNGAEYDYTNRIDILSNGFKARTDSSGVNGSGVSYIYLAFAEAPFVNSNGVPCNAN